MTIKNFKSPTRLTFYFYEMGLTEWAFILGQMPCTSRGQKLHSEKLSIRNKSVEHATWNILRKITFNHEPMPQLHKFICQEPEYFPSLPGEIPEKLYMFLIL